LKRTLKALALTQTLCQQHKHGDTRTYTITVRVPGIALPVVYKSYLFALEFPNVFLSVLNLTVMAANKSKKLSRSDKSLTPLQ
jgi:hypothetical protein